MKLTGFLNRLAWIVSFLVPFVLIFSIFVDDIWSFPIIFTILILGIIIKNLLFPVYKIKQFEQDLYDFYYYKRTQSSEDVETYSSQKPKTEEKSYLEQNLGITNQQNSSVSQDNYIFKTEKNIETSPKVEEVSYIVEKTQNENSSINGIKETSQQIEQKIENYSYENEKESNIFEDSIKKFFSENLLAKVGVLVIFVAILTLLAITWNDTSDLLKVLIGLAIGFACYIGGVILHKKGYEGEAKVLMGIGISINLLVTLISRFFQNAGHEIFSTDGISIVFSYFSLFFHVGLGLYTGLVYKSQTFMVFSFILAYLNPFFAIWLEFNPEIFFILIYSFIITLAAIFIGEKVENKYLLILSFLFGNIYFIFLSKNGNWDSKELGFLLGFTFTIITSFILINTKTTDKLKIDWGDFTTNFIIFSPILLHIFYNKISLNELGTGFKMIICLYAAIIFGFLYYKTKIEARFLPFATALTALIFIGGFDLKEDYFAIIAAVIIILANLYAIYPFENLREKHNLGAFSVSLIVSGIFFTIVTWLQFEEKSWIGFLIISFVYLIIGIVSTGISSLKDFKESELKQLFFTYFTFFATFFTTGIIVLILSEIKLDFEIRSLLIAIFLSIESILISSLYKNLGEIKFKILSNIISFIGIFFVLIPVLIRINSEGNNSLLIITSSVLFITYVLKILFSLGKLNEADYILHIAGTTLTFVLLYKTDLNISTVVYTIILLIAGLGLFYKIIEDDFLKMYFVFLLTCFFIYQIFYFISEKKVFVGILGIAVFFIVSYYYQLRKDKYYQTINLIYYIFLFIMATLIVKELTDYTKFEDYDFIALWGIVGIILIWYGIINNKSIFRTIGLYLIVLIFSYIILILVPKIFNSEGGAVIGVLFLLALGIVLIGLSTFYTKVIGADISKDFSLSNIFGNDLDNFFPKTEKSVEINEKLSSSNIETKVDYFDEGNIISKINNININDLQSISLVLNEVTFTTNSPKLMKIMKYIFTTLQKNIFDKNELVNIYNTIGENYYEELDSKEKAFYRENFSIFAKSGGILKLNKL